jgi:L-iditol 2-dehydrogenase
MRSKGRPLANPKGSNANTGDRVAVEPGVACGRCFLCVEGRYNLCEDVAFAGVYPHAGTIQRYTVHAANRVHVLPKSIDFEVAALLEPLSVALHALRTTPIHIGTPVAVFGAGPIGLMAMAVARASGAHPVIITDVDPARLEFAREFEPRCQTYQVHPDSAPDVTGQGIRRLFEPQRHGAEGVSSERPAHSEYDMPHLVLECTGIESSIATAAYTVRRGGSINVVGVSSKATINNIPFMHLSLAEVKLRFINRYTDTWPAAIRAVDGGLIESRRLRSLITHRFRLGDALEAMELVGGVRKLKDGERLIKVQILDEDELNSDLGQAECSK